MSQVAQVQRNCPVTDFDHAFEHGRRDLLDWGDRFRRDSPIVWSKAHGGVWLVSRFEDIAEIALNTKVFISGKGITFPPQGSPVPVVPAEADPPLHTHYRAVLMPFLRPGPVKAREEKIREIIVESLQEIITRGEGDVVADFAAKVPARAMAVVFGFSDDDAYAFDRGFTEVVNAAGSDDVERQGRAVSGFFEFLKEKLAEGAANPELENVVTAMLQYDKDGKRFSEEECLGLLWSTAGGAVDTTKHSIGHLIHNLAKNPEVRQRLVDNPGLIPTAVEENLRLDAPAYMVSRYVAEDVEIGGVQMQSGDRVMLMFGWGNLDEKQFECPMEFRPERKPNRHLSFGYGIHQCIGMHLARLEIRVALEEFLKRIPSYELVRPDDDPHVRGGMMWSFDRLPIRIA